MKPGARLGPYEILAPLGAGGMGEVYRARDARLSREVAIKVLPGEVASDASRLRRFEKEARSASALNHPNIVTVLDIGTTGGVPWIAMERVKGETLRKVLMGGALPVWKLLPIAAQIADGLAKAHEAGIVHRDLKPENVMVTKDGLVKILDFGLAKLTGPFSLSDEGSRPLTETGTSSGLLVGTAGYMSPEQASGGSIDYRSDQFSFGLILYEMATGRRAFQKKTAVDTMSAILNEEPEPITSVNPRAPVPVRWIVERCLSKDPEHRYVSTRDLARDLAAGRDHISEVTSRAGAPVAALVKRRRILLALLSGAAALALGAAGWVLARNLLSQDPAPTTLRRLTFRSGNVNAGDSLMRTGEHALSPDGNRVIGLKGTPGVDGSWWLIPVGGGEPRSLRTSDDTLYYVPQGALILTWSDRAVLADRSLDECPLSHGAGQANGAPFVSMTISLPVPPVHIEY